MITEENYESEAEAVVGDYEYETLEELEADYGKFSIITNLIRDKALNFLYDSASIEEVSEDEYYGENEEALVEDTEM